MTDFQVNNLKASHFCYNRTKYSISIWDISRNFSFVASRYKIPRAVVESVWQSE